jgi:hypothetical protein
MTQKDVAVDRYLTDYEDGKLDREVIKRIEKLSGRLTELRHRRDGLLFELDNTPSKITKDELDLLGKMIKKLIATGSGPQQKAVCEATLSEIKINTSTSTATPIFVIDVAEHQALNDESAPTGNPVGALLLGRCSRAYTTSGLKVSESEPYFVLVRAV